jgi:hypothetical protein
MILKDEQMTVIDGCFSHDGWCFAVDTSSLGLSPGEWPAQLETSVGNGNPLIRDESWFDANNDLCCVIYRQADGCTVHIIND